MVKGKKILIKNYLLLQYKVILPKHSSPYILGWLGSTTLEGQDFESKLAKNVMGKALMEIFQKGGGSFSVQLIMSLSFDH